jgi:hypothetical protein
MTSPHAPTQSPSPNREELRKRTLWLIATVVAVHALMIGIYYGLHVNLRADKTQQTFIAVWVVLTLAVILPQMKRIRAMRRLRR